MVEFGGDKKVSPGPGASFGGIVGQAELKEALLAVAAHDGLDGLLIRGEKGTAKSTAVRALADLLPTQRAVADCPYGCPPDRPAAQCADCRDRADPPVEERPVPLVTLPLGATRERVVGTLSVADALDGEPSFDPGLLARANRGLLYVDEVNLLDDHLVDVLLDAAASGVNRVERDGVSVAHPADFTLIGTMNPEEGSLRPQLRDRFALQATVSGCDDVDRRVAIIDRALAEDEEGDGNADGNGAPTAEADGGAAGAEGTAAYRRRLRRARERLPGVALPGEFKREIAELCLDAGVEGHRGDIAVARTAAALAALDDRPKVLEPDVRRAAELALPHRLQSKPFEEAPDPQEAIDDRFGDRSDEGDGTGERADEAAGTDAGEGDGAEDGEESGADGEDGAGTNDDSGKSDDGGTDEPRSDGDADDGEPPESEAGSRSDEGSAGDGSPSPTPASGDGSGDGNGAVANDADPGDADPEGDGTAESDAESDPTDTGTPLLPGQSRAGVGTAAAPEVEAPEVDAGSRAGGDRATAGASPDGEGPRVRTERATGRERIDPAASVRAAASRGGDAVASRDLRCSVRAGRAATLVLFVVDASASMRGPMRAAKGVVLELLRDAYEGRDEVGLVAFAGEDAQVLLPPTDSVDLAARHLKELPTGDRTPLPAGLWRAVEVLDRADPDAAVVVLVSDGRANADEHPTAATRRAAAGIADRDARLLAVDAGDGGRDRASLLGEVVTATDGRRVPLDALSAERVDRAARRTDADSFTT